MSLIFKDRIEEFLIVIEGKAMLKGKIQFWRKTLRF